MTTLQAGRQAGRQAVNPFTALVEHLDGVERELVTRLDAVHRTQEALRVLVGQDVPTPAARLTTRRAKPATMDGPLEGKILAALAAGPKRQGDLAETLKLSRYRLQRQLDALIARKVVVIRGKTSDRRVALAGAPAKEAP